MNHISPIVQMLLGKKGHVESVVHSDEHKKMANIFYDKYESFIQKYADNKEMIKDFKNVCDARDGDQATAEEDFYVAGFSFGVLMGIDIMNVNLKND